MYWNMHAYCTPIVRVRVRVRIQVYYALRYGRATSPLWALRRPYCPTEVEARWWYSFSKTIQNVPSVGSGVDADRTGKRKLNFNGVLQDQWGSAEMATGVLHVRVFPAPDHYL